MIATVPQPGGGRIGLCTDSNSQIPPVLRERYDVEVVPLTLVIDEQEFLEGVDIDADSFYELFSNGRRPDATFIKPSSGQFAVAYDELAARGCTQILSIHTSLEACSILHAARLAARCSPVPVRLVDSGTARFGVSCCVWAAGDALATGASLDEAAEIAESLAPVIGGVFIVSALDFLGPNRTARSRAVLTMIDGQISEVERVDSMVDAVNSMARQTLSWGDGLKIAIGNAHRNSWPIAEALAHAVGETAAVQEVVHFRIGPSVGIDCGPGAVSCIAYPA